MALWFRGEGLKSRVGADVCDAVPRDLQAFLDAHGYVLELFILDGPFVPVLARIRSDSRTYPYQAWGGAAKTTLEDSVRSSALEAVQTSIALSLSEDRYLKWLARPQIRTLDHNMYWHASPAHATSVDESLGTLQNMTSSRLGEPLVWFVDVTPPPLRDELRCVRALSNDYWPLVVSERHGPLELVRGGPTMTPDPDDVREVAAAIVGAFGRNDTDAYFAGFDPRATFLFHTEPELLPNRAAYERLWDLWQQSGWGVVECESSGATVTCFDGGAVFTHTVRTVTQTPEGREETFERESIVFTYDGTRLVAIHEHLSPAPTGATS